MGCSSEGTLPSVFCKCCIVKVDFNFGVSSLDAIVADGWIRVDSKADADERCRASNGSSGAAATVGSNAADTEFAEKGGTPHPGCFL